VVGAPTTAAQSMRLADVAESAVRSSEDELLAVVEDLPE
jgi:hypothetical protein